MTTTEFDFFQMPAAGVTGGGNVGVTQQGRSFDKKMSNWGDLASTPANVFKGKDELSNVQPTDMDTVKDENPFEAGTHLRRVKNDRLIRMMIADDAPFPGKDVSDKKEATVDNSTYLPSEGWRSFGGKGDKSRTYQGSRLQG